MTRRALAALAAVAAALATGGSAGGAQIVGIASSSQSLVLFDTGAPRSYTGVPVSGLASGESLRALDVRPATGELYAIAVKAGTTDTARLYRIDWGTGVATAVGASSFPISPGIGTSGGYGMDFDPVADTLRVVNSADANLRVDAATGSVLSVGASLAPTGEQIAAIAYDRSVSGSTATTLLAVVTANPVDRLIRLGGSDGTPSPDGGSTESIGSLGLNATTSASLDVSSEGIAYLADGTSFGQVDPTTGSFRLAFRVATALSGLAVLRPSTISFESRSVTAIESEGVATLTVRRSSPATGTVTVDYTTVTETATDADVVPVSGRLRFGPGVTSQTIAVPIRDDGVAEDTETLRVELSGASIGATASKSPAVITLADAAPPALPADVLPPTVVILTQGRVGRHRARRAIPLMAACFEACRLTVEVRLGNTVLGRASTSLSPSSAANLAIRPRKAGTRAIDRALDRNASIVVVLIATVADTVGNTSTVRRPITISR